MDFYTAFIIQHLEEKPNKSYHIYDSNIPLSPCPFLTFHKKGKKEGIHYCKFDFKNNGKELDANKIFKYKKEGEKWTC